MNKKKTSSLTIALLLAGLTLLLVSEWTATKQAAKDAWNGTYNPIDENIVEVVDK